MAGHDGECSPGVIDGEREHRYTVERAAGRHHAESRNQSEAGFKADDIVEARRYAAGAGGVGAERQRHETCGNRNAGAGARSAGNEIGVEKIARRAVGRTHADKSGGKLVEIGLADDDGAGFAQARNRCGIVGRVIGKGRACVGSRHAGNINIVLDRDGHAIERAICGVRTGKRVRIGDGIGFLAQTYEHGRII